MAPLKSARMKSARSESGQALVEFALVAPILLFLVIGCVEFARAWNVRQVLTYASRDAARLASLPSAAIDEDSVKSAIRFALQAGSLDNALADVKIEGLAGDPGTVSRVEISYPYQLSVLRLLGGDQNGKLTLRSASVMRNE